MDTFPPPQQSVKRASVGSGGTRRSSHSLFDNASLEAMFPGSSALGRVFDSTETATCMQPVKSWNGCNLAAASWHAGQDNHDSRDFGNTSFWRTPPPSARCHPEVPLPVEQLCYSSFPACACFANVCK